MVKIKLFYEKSPSHPPGSPFRRGIEKPLPTFFSSRRFGNISDVSGKVFLFFEIPEYKRKNFLCATEKREETDFPKKKKIYEKTLTKENPGIIIKAD